MSQLKEVFSELVFQGYAYFTFDYQLLLNALSARDRLIHTERLPSTENKYNRVWRDRILKDDKSVYTRHCLGIMDDLYQSIFKQLDEAMSQFCRQFAAYQLRPLLLRSFTHDSSKTSDLQLTSGTATADSETFLTIYLGGDEAEVLVRTDRHAEFKAAPPRGSALVYFGPKAPALLGVDVTVPNAKAVPPFTGSYLQVRVADEVVAIAAVDNVRPLKRRRV